MGWAGQKMEGTGQEMEGAVDAHQDLKGQGGGRELYVAEDLVTTPKS